MYIHIYCIITQLIIIINCTFVKHCVCSYSSPAENTVLSFSAYSTFSGNRVSRMEVEATEIQDNSPQHAAISSYRFPLHFTGTNQLLHNDGGGLSAMGSVVRVDGRLIVRNNTASHGGGIHLEDHCVVWLCMSLSPCVWEIECTNCLHCMICI